MRKLLIIFSTFLGVQAFATYDNSWYQADYWSGEWPNGFSIVQPGLVLKGRGL